MQNVRVTDWQGLVSHLHRTRSYGLDLRRIAHVNPKAPEETWNGIVSALEQAPPTLRRLELPRVTPVDVHKAAAACAHPLDEFLAVNIAQHPSQVGAGVPEVDMEALATSAALRSSLTSLKIKTASGKMRLSGAGLTPLGALAETLTKLVSNHLNNL